MLTETKRTARRLYSHKNIYLLIGDQLDSLLNPIDLPRLDPRNRLTMESCIRLALVTAFQLAESLPDELAAKAVLERVDWKYALDLPIEHLGISGDDLCAFRKDLFSSPSALKEFGSLLANLNSLGLFTNPQISKLSPAAALVTLCQVNHLYEMDQKVKSALGLLSSSVPDLGLNHFPSYQDNCYLSSPLQPLVCISGEEMQKEAEKIGEDIHQLLSKIKEQKLSEFSKREEIRQIARLFSEEFIVIDDKIRWQLPVYTNFIPRQHEFEEISRYENNQEAR